MKSGQFLEAGQLLADLPTVYYIKGLSALLFAIPRKRMY